MDDIDRAQQREERDREMAIAAARRMTILPSTGHCHWCDASVSGAAHFCDRDCAADYERDTTARQRNGRAA